MGMQHGPLPRDFLLFLLKPWLCPQHQGSTGVYFFGISHGNITSSIKRVRPLVPVLKTEGP